MKSSSKCFQITALRNLNISVLYSAIVLCLQ